MASRRPVSFVILSVLSWLIFTYRSDSVWHISQQSLQQGLRADLVAHQSDNLNLRSTQGSVIGGKLVDANGKPIANAVVRLLLRVFSNGTRRLIPLTSTLPMGSAGGIGYAATGSDGTFRLNSIPPGRYYLAATTTLAQIVSKIGRAHV